VPQPTQFIEFAAAGRGGQFIRVLPELNVIVVTTGGGFEWNDVAALLAPALVDPLEPITDNPAGSEQLKAALDAIRLPPLAQAIPPLPAAAQAISGKTYAFDLSPLDLRTMRFEFDDTAEAKLHVAFYNQPEQDLLVGLDGVYRFYPIGEHRLPLGVRGSWSDSQTFLFEYDSVANQDAYALEMRFEGDHVTITAHERTHDASLTLEGKLLSQ
jgi:hypothetical protein